MADYDDSASVYDGSVNYDEPVVPQLEIKKMAKVKLGLGGMTPDEILSLTDQIITAMTGNANFTTPNPTLASVSTALATATTKVAAQKAAAQAAKQATDDRDAAITTLSGLVTSLGDYVSNVTQGNKVKIESAGMSVKASAAPIGPLAQVQNLSITAGDAEGRLDLQWDPVRGTKNIDEAFDEISEELRSQYAIGYYPTNPKRDGTYRKIRVDIVPKDMDALTRKGYYAPQD